MKRYKFVDAIKSISMVGVVLWHCMLFYADNPFWPFRANEANLVVIFLNNFFECSFVPLFVLASGFLFCKTAQNKKRKTVDLIVGRAKRLLLPWLLYGLIWLVPTYTILDIESFGRSKGASWLEGYRAMLLGQFADVAWFLPMLFWVSLIWCLLRFFLHKSRIWIGFIVAIALTIVAHLCLANVDYYKLSQIDQYILYFYIGAIVYCYMDSFEKLNPTKLSVISGMSLLVVVILSQYAVGNFYLTLITKSINILALFIFTFSIYQTGLLNGKKAAKWVDWMEMHCMDVYLFQVPWIYVYFILFYPIVGKYDFVCILCNFVATAITVYIICQFITFLKSKIGFANR